MREILIPFIYFVIVSVAMSLLFDKKFGFCLPLSFIISTLICLLTGLIFDSLTKGIYTLYFLFFVSIIYILHVIIKKKNKFLLKKVFSYGFLCFMIIYILFFILDYNRNFQIWDELAHWGIMIKAMFKHNQLHTNVPESFFHKEYPPFAQIFEYLWLKLQGVFKEEGVSKALHIFQISIFCVPLVEIITKFKKWFINVLATVICVIFTLLFVCSFDVYILAQSIYLDIVPALFFAYVFMVVYECINKNEKKDLFNRIILITSTLSLVLLKETSIVFWGMIAAFVILKSILDFALEKKKPSIYIIVATIIVPIIVTVLWKIKVSSFAVSGQFNLSKLDFNTIYNIFFIKRSTIQDYVINTFFVNLYTLPLNVGLIELPYIFCVIFIIGVLTIVYIFTKRNFLFRNFISVVSMLIIGAIVYAIVHLLVYLFFMSKDEMMNLASFNRYMDTFVLSVVLIGAYLTFKYIIIEFNKSFLFLLIIAYVLIVSPLALKTIQIENEDLDYVKYAREMTININKLGLEKQNNNVYFIMTDYFYGKPMAVEYNSENFNYSRANWDNKLIKEVDNDKWKTVIETIGKFDYLAIVDISEIVTEKLSQFIDENDSEKSLRAESLYKVNNEEGKLKLTKVQFK